MSHKRVYKNYVYSDEEGGGLRGLVVSSEQVLVSLFMPSPWQQTLQGERERNREGTE